MKYKDITGQRFGRLTVIRPTEERTKNKGVIWECQCDCGNIVKTSTGSLRMGHALSCGCLNKESRMANAKKAAKASHQDGTAPCRLKPTNPPQTNNTSGVRGVSWHKSARKYQAYITVRQKRIYLGCFETLEEATEARKQAEDKYFAPILEEIKRKEADNADDRS